MRTQIAIRDAFLARMAQVLADRVAALSSTLGRVKLPASARHAVEALDGFSHELSLISGVTAVSTDGPRIDLREVVQHRIAALQPDATKRGRTIRFFISKPVHVRCAADDMETVLMELVSNCVKYGRGPVMVEVTATRTFARLRVRDGGAGVPRGHRPGRFVRGRAHRVMGFGVGLWLVQTIARAHGGKLSLEGSKGVQVSFRRA